MEQHGLYRSGDFPEDYEMWLRWLDQGVKIAKVPQIVLDWHDSETRLTRTDSIYSDRAFYEVKSRYLAKWLSEHNPFHPYVHVWGASRISRRRVRILEKHGMFIMDPSTFGEEMAKMISTDPLKMSLGVRDNFAGSYKGAFQWTAAQVKLDLLPEIAIEYDRSHS